MLLPNLAEVRNRLEDLFENKKLTQNEVLGDTKPEGICACGSKSGAEYYATKHNSSGESDFPIAIQFKAPLDKIHVDGRDFLFTVFQLWDRNTSSHREWVAMWLETLYGKAITRYFIKASGSSDQDYRIAMCTLACIDPAVVKHHLKNRTTIGGRYRTRFASAFIVTGPIPPSCITCVETPGLVEYPEVAISVDQILNGP
jgi:hypothetical protein